MLKVGLTGGIGSGKSIVAQTFKLFGIPVFNSGHAAKAVIQENQLVKAKIIDLFGLTSYDDAGNYNRIYVASIVFNDPKKLAQLNAIVHPAVGKLFETFCTAHPNAAYIIYESALFLEAGLQARVYKLMTVVAPMELRIKNITQRDHYTPEEILQRMNNQTSDEAKIAVSDFVIYNQPDQSLIQQVVKIHSELQRLKQ